MSFTSVHKGGKVDFIAISKNKELVYAPIIRSFESMDADGSIYEQERVNREGVAKRALKTNLRVNFANIGVFQPKLKISQPNDPYEQEADRIAEHVMRMHVSSRTSSSMAAQKEQGINQKCMSCKTKIREEDNEKLTISRKSSSPTSSYEAATRLQDKHCSSSGLPLDVNTKEFMESRFGFDFSKVRIHSDQAAEVSTKSISGLAYTKGTDIFFGKGQYEPSTWQGKRLLAHELAHVIQQTRISKLGSSTNIRQDFVPHPKEVIIGRKPAVSNIRIEGGEEADRASREFINLVKEQQTRKPVDPLFVRDEEVMKEIIHKLPLHQVKRLEKEVLLWPKVFAQKDTHRRIIDMITKVTRKSDIEESKRGRFPEDKGEEIKREMSLSADQYKQYAFYTCLKFIYESAVFKLYADKDKEKVEKARLSYSEGVKERLAPVKSEETRLIKEKLETKGIPLGSKKDLSKEEMKEIKKAASKKRTLHIETLSRLASELRLQGLVGPANILRWNGDPAIGKHEKHPAELFDNLSEAGNGWYFFLVSLKSYHTFIIAVHVSDGRDRTYFRIQGAHHEETNRDGLKRYFDNSFRNKHKGADTRVWQVYFKPTE